MSVSPLPTDFKTTRLSIVELAPVMVESAILTYLKDLAASGLVPDPVIAKSTRFEFSMNQHGTLGCVKIIYTMPDEI